MWDDSFQNELVMKGFLVERVGIKGNVEIVVEV